MNIDIWTQSFGNALTRFWTEIAGFLPNLIATIIFIFIGLFLSKFVTKWFAKVIEKVGFNTLCDMLGIERGLKTLGFKLSPSSLVGRILYLFFVLIILVAGAETLGLDRLSSLLDEFVLYLPKLVGAVVITVIGLFIAKAAKKQVEASFENMGIEFGDAAAKILQMLVIFITFSLVVGQLQLETELLNTIFTVLIASMGVALALALGLGTKAIANSIVSGIYAREQLLPGDEIEFDGFIGNVIQVSTVNTILENKDGLQMSIPNQDLLTKTYTITKLAERWEES
jgi:small-conductance mechanosensitive channel